MDKPIVVQIRLSDDYSITFPIDDAFATVESIKKMPGYEISLLISAVSTITKATMRDFVEGIRRGELPK